MWITRATWAASNCGEAPFRDTEASQWRADLSRKKVRAKKAAAAAELALNPLASGPYNLRGHDPVQMLQLSGIRSGWRCSIYFSDGHDRVQMKELLLKETSHPK